MHVVLAGRIEVEAAVCCSLFHERASDSLLILLLTIWGVTPSSAYLRGLSTIIAQLRDSLTSPDFFRHFLHTSRPACFSRLLFLLSVLYVVDTRDSQLECEKSVKANQDLLIKLFLLEKRLGVLAQYVTGAENANPGVLVGRIRQLQVFFSA